MWLAIVLAISPALTSLPMPLPGIAVSLAMTVRSRLPWRTSSSITRSGVPTPMKPPIIRLAPSGIMATASATSMVFMRASPAPESSDRQLRSAYVLLPGKYVCDADESATKPKH